MDKQGRITNISEVKIGGEYRWKKGASIDADRIIVTEKPAGKPYLVAKVNGLQINLWHWRGRLMPWTNKEHEQVAPANRRERLARVRDCGAAVAALWRYAQGTDPLQSTTADLRFHEPTRNQSA